MDRKKTSASTKKKETPQPSAEASPSPPSILVPLCLLESTVKGYAINYYFLVDKINTAGS